MAAPPLPEELVEEALLRFPPDDPASLARAALVSKQWCRLICGAHHGFSRRFREFHRSPPLLGFLFIRFNPAGPASRGWRAVHSGQGRVLLHHASTNDNDDLLVVWDPITDEQRELRLPNWNAAVLCAAAAATGGGCNHLDCHRGPFVVILVGTIFCNRSETFSCVYSSEADGWSEPVFDRLPYQFLDPGSVGALLGNSLYFMYESTQRILKYDLLTQEMSAIPDPVSSIGTGRRTVLMATEDGRLGLATVRESRLYLWSREQGPNGDAGWTQSRVINLDALIPRNTISTSAQAAGFADNGAGGVVFVWTTAGWPMSGAAGAA
ncbi:hypothetical protein PVAP13_6NG218800 [Panicum virgatum]|uniref:F-box domain-containing protein n=1 Tax=Panicum virgatum TaxID=38727 RepID=A0A8T0R0M2_PANVG|nr:hypothetical protein PVAP13_6NG218800 [Panicum virgatum]